MAQDTAAVSVGEPPARRAGAECLDRLSGQIAAAMNPASCAELKRSAPAADDRRCAEQMAVAQSLALQQHGERRHQRRSQIGDQPRFSRWCGPERGEVEKNDSQRSPLTPSSHTPTGWRSAGPGSRPAISPRASPTDRPMPKHMAVS
jgi:hypothetical protein